MPRLKRTEEEEKAREGSEFIESLDRGLRVIQSFGIDRRPMTLSDLSKSADLPRATVRRILMTLVKSGFVVSDERLFSLTPRVLLLASAYLTSNQISTVMQPLMDEVAGKVRRSAPLRSLMAKRSFYRPLESGAGILERTGHRISAAGFLHVSGTRSAGQIGKRRADENGRRHEAGGSDPVDAARQIGSDCDNHCRPHQRV